MNASMILLEPLSAAESGALIGNLLGSADLPADVRNRITAAAEGNPLFVEEMLGMLIDEGHLLRDGEGWAPAADLTTVAVPPTIQALLAARLDRLDVSQREVLERASVVGQEFWRGAVVELSPETDQPGVPTNLMTLVRKELIRPGRSSFVGEDGFRFRHLLIRDAAYDSMPKEMRAELHERFAAWLERVAGEGVSEFEAILGYHLEQAVRYRRELSNGPSRTSRSGRTTRRWRSPWPGGGWPSSGWATRRRRWPRSTAASSTPGGSGTPGWSWRSSGTGSGRTRGDRSRWTRRSPGTWASSTG